MDGGIVAYNGHLHQLEEETLNMDTQACFIKDASFSQKLRTNNKYVMKQFASPKLDYRLKCEIALSHLLTRACGAHYVLDQTNYLPYIKYKSRRAVVTGKFLSFDMFNKQLPLSLTRLEGEHDEVRIKLSDALIGALNKRLEIANSLELSSKEPKEVEIKIRVKDGP